MPESWGSGDILTDDEDLWSGNDGVEDHANEHEELMRLRRENRILKEERDILKRQRRTSRRAVLSTYSSLLHENEFRIGSMCRVLVVSRSATTSGRIDLKAQGHQQTRGFLRESRRFTKRV